MSLRALGAAALLTLMAACGAPARPIASRGPPIAAPKKEPSLFETLVADVRAHHVFSEQTQKNLGRRWEEALPVLEREFAEAKTDAALTVALTHFVSSLHDAHCSFDPDGPAKVVALGVRADVEWKDGKPRFYISRVDDANKDRVAPGDAIRSIDGVAERDLVAHFLDVSRQNNLRSVALDVAEHLTRRRSTSSLTAEGDVSRWVVASSKTHADEMLTLTWTKASRHEVSFDEFAIDYERPWCSTLAARGYGPYEVTVRGMNFCVYASQVEPYKSHPIVRQFSFLYLSSEGETEHAQHRVRADHDLLARELGRLAPKGVLLDLRDNHGGNDPNWFMDWYGSGPYVDRFVLERLAPDLDTPDKLEAVGAGYVKEYLKELHDRTPDQTFMKPRPFFCKGDDCAWDNRYVPAHRVTKAPVALLVGPRCVSSCDSVAQLFAENHFGPLVGEPTAAAYTTNRIHRPIVVHGKTLGTMNLAFTREISGKTHEPIEAVPLAIDVPIDRTFENRDAYDKLLVDAAIHKLTN